MPKLSSVIHMNKHHLLNTKYVIIKMILKPQIQQSHPLYYTTVLIGIYIIKTTG